MSTLKPTYLHFRFSGRLAQLLGRQSLATEIRALFELVKNSYDADATECRVVFENILRGTGKISIKDNGIGMNEDDFKNKFMVVATSNKLRKRTTDAGRLIVGEKGVGRFAMESLARKVTIVSNPKNEPGVTYQLQIDWDKYELEGVTFDQVGNTFEKFRRSNPKDHGLEIVLENLRNPWDQEKIQRLMNQLGSLVAPTQFQPQPPFNIIVDAPEFDIPPSLLESRLFDKAMYRIKATLSDGRIHLTVWDKNEKVSEIVDKKEIVRKVSTTIDEVPMRCGPVKYYLWAFPPGHGKRQIDEFTRYYGIKSWPLIASMLSEYSGIKIYRDGFHVKPYGDKGDDWTGKNESARQISGGIPNHSVIGIVEISSKTNPTIVDTMTRAEVIENDSFEDLRSFVKQCNKALDNYLHVKKDLRPDKVKRNVSANLEATTEKVEELPVPQEVKATIVKELKQQSAALKAQEEEDEKEKERLMTKIEAYHNLASLGISTAVVAHEIKESMRILLTLTSKLEDQVRTGSPLTKELVDNLIRVISHIKYIHHYMSFVRSFTAALKSQEKDFRKMTDFYLHEQAEDLVADFSEVLRREDIIIDSLIPEGLDKIRMFPTDLQSILVNLITNSVKAIRNSRNNGSAIPRVNHIKISLLPDPNNLALSFSDDGPGIKESVRQFIFEPFVSEYEGDGKGDDSLYGSGLGLPIVKETLESYAGSIEIGESEFGSGANFLIKIPWQNIKAN